MTTKSKAQKGKRSNPAAQTVAQLIDNEAVPVGVRLWLEQYTETGDEALDTYGANTDEATLELARLVYDVLQSKYLETGTGADERNFSEEARDFVEEFIYKMAEGTDVQIWNHPDIAAAALPTLLDCTNGGCGESATLTLLRAGVERLSTRRELREFLKDGAERYGINSEDERNNEAAYKLSRVLADPRTPQETHDALVDALNEFSMSSRVTVAHPALARRAFQLMCESKPKGNVRECKKDRRELLAMLDLIPDEKGGGDE